MFSKCCDHRPLFPRPDGSARWGCAHPGGEPTDKSRDFRIKVKVLTLSTEPDRTQQRGDNHLSSPKDKRVTGFPQWVRGRRPANLPPPGRPRAQVAGWDWATSGVLFGVSGRSGCLPCFWDRMWGGREMEGPLKSTTRVNSINGSAE